jgi:hypothetical protein
MSDNHNRVFITGMTAGGWRLTILDYWRSGETVRVMTTAAPFGGEVSL